MEVDVLVEPIDGGRFRASYTLLDLIVERDTRAEALAELRAAIDRQIAEGVEFVTISIPNPPRRNLRHMGTMEDDEVHREWLAILAENRRRADIEEGIVLEPAEARAGA